MNTNFSENLDIPLKSLGACRRIWMLALGYLVYVAAGPGIILPGGTPIGALGLVPWALAASRPGPWKKRIEWVAGATAFTIQGAWMGTVFWFAPVWLFLGYGVWAVWGGWLMIRLARQLPLSLATPVAWIGFESLLAWMPPPVGLSWLRLGHYLAAVPALAGSGRVWGVMGLGFVLASAAGLVADGVRARGISVGRSAWAYGLIPTGFAVVLAVSFSSPAVETGPRLLLVQPNISQARKQSSGDPAALLRQSLELTESGLAEIEECGALLPHLVCWSETMFGTLLCENGLGDTILDLEVDPWSPLAGVPSESLVSFVHRCEARESQILESLFGRDGPLRDRSASYGEETRTWNGRTGFLSGAELLVGHAGRVRRTNAVLLWDDKGRKAIALKQHLAPGGETMVGLEKFDAVREVILDVANYVPDFLAGVETTVMTLDGEDGLSWRMGVSICFDNAFDGVYAAPLARGELDFHLVVSNEAWYLDSQELDHMVAFSRLHALCTGRALIRCANSGVSCAVGPDGREIARLTVDASDRQVRGTLVVDVPVPTNASSAERTPYVALQPWLLPFGALLPLFIMLLLGMRTKIDVEEPRSVQ